jgi:ABC-type multidrug transport system fused ATPase/permease subunit
MTMNQKTHLNSVFDFVKSLFFRIEKYKFAGMALPLIFGQALYIFLPMALGFIVDGVFINKWLKAGWLLLFPALWGLSYVFFCDFAIFYLSHYSGRSSVVAS